jgi:hypothetical protein
MSTQEICTECIVPLSGPDTFRQCQHCSCLKCNACAEDDFTGELCGICIAWCAECEAPALNDMTCSGCAAVFCFDCATDSTHTFVDATQNMEIRELAMTCTRCPNCI